MDMYGYNQSISSGNNYNSIQEEGNQDIRIRNQNLDRAVSDLKGSIAGKQGVVDDKTKASLLLLQLNQ